MIKLDESVALQAGHAESEQDPMFIPHWYALYTRSRHEKILDERLKMKGLESYLPLRKITRKWSDRKQIIEEPLFKGYLFVRIPLINRWEVLNTVGAVQFVQFKASKPCEVAPKDIETIRTFAESSLPVDPFPYIKEGARAYIRSGPMKGVEGFIVRKDSHCRIVLSVTSLMKSISIQVDEANVELL